MTDSGITESSLVSHLKTFNRKERFWLLANALGRHTDHPSEPPQPPQLSEEFCTILSKQIGKTVPVSAWWAMDYHIDWLVGVGYLLKFPDDTCWETPKFTRKKTLSRGAGTQEVLETLPLVTGTQEDIDLIIAFGSTLILIEAKGETSWTNEQVNSKIQRLRALLDKHSFFKNVTVHFVLMSPEESKGLESEDDEGWPEWMLNGDKPKFIRLSMPRALKKVVRCDEGRNPSKTGSYFKVKQKS